MPSMHRPYPDETFAGPAVMGYKGYVAWANKCKEWTKKLATNVHKRAKEKGIPLADALREVMAEEKFSQQKTGFDQFASNRQKERDQPKGGRVAFSNAVNEMVAQLIRRESEGGRAFYLRAANEVSRKRPDLLKAYRMDAKELR
jgi:hypothetical protein